MQQVKNIQFTNLIKAGGRLHEFNFRKSTGIDGPVFTVDVADQYGVRQYVMFRQEQGEWVLKTNHIPAWIEEALPKIKQAITDAGILINVLTTK